MPSSVGLLLSQFFTQSFDAGSVESDGDVAGLAVDTLQQVAENPHLIGAGQALPSTVEQIGNASQFFLSHVLAA